MLWLAARCPDEGRGTGRLFYFVGLVGPLSLQSQDHPSLLNSNATCLLAGKSKMPFTLLFPCLTCTGNSSRCYFRNYSWLCVVLRKGNYTCVLAIVGSANITVKK